MKLAAYQLLTSLGLLASVFIVSAREKTQAYRDCKLRARLNARQIDQMIEDSFPCSDPPSTY